MPATYLGPFAGLANGFPGWSNHATGPGTFKARYDDGDPAASMIWREMAGNADHQLSRSRRIIWADSFIGPDPADTDPTYHNDHSDWMDIDCIYAWTPAIIVIPGARRGVDRPPRVEVRVRALGAGSTVRVYSVAHYREIQAHWDGANTYRTADIPIVNDTYPPDASYGLLPSAGFYALDLSCARTALVHPAIGVSREVGMEVLTTHLVICAIMAPGGENGPYVAAIEIWEEEPAA